MPAHANFSFRMAKPMILISFCNALIFALKQRRTQKCANYHNIHHIQMVHCQPLWLNSVINGFFSLGLLLAHHSIIWHHPTLEITMSDFFAPLSHEVPHVVLPVDVLDNLSPPPKLDVGDSWPPPPPRLDAGGDNFPNPPPRPK